MNIQALRKESGPARRLFGDYDAATIEDRNYRNLMLSGAWFGPVDGGIFNFLPVFMARLGASPSLISLLTSGPSLLGIITYLPGGAYVERQPDLIRTLVRAVFVSRLFYLIIALTPLFVPHDVLPVLLVALWILSSLPSAIHIPAFAAMMQRAIPAQRRARFNGTRWGLMSLISGTTIALFGFLLDRTAFPLGYQIVFLVSFGASLLNMYYFGRVQLLPEERSADRDHSGATRPAEQAVAPSSPIVHLRNFLRSFTAHPPFVRFNLASFSFRLALMMPAGLFSIYWVRALNANDSWIGLRGTAGYAALVLGYWLWGRVATRIGHRNVLLLCGAAGAFYPILTALAPSVEWLLPAAALWGLTISGVDIGLFDMMLLSSPAGRLPSFAAMANMLSNIALAIGPLLGAGLAGAIGIREALLVVGGLQLAATAGFLLLPGLEEERAMAH
ncbi:MAG: MFS transporter [Anaerolineae bacterium]|nr:MFS transporter [Anaerolineae bacterium]